jgi:hypothetical protein
MPYRSVHFTADRGSHPHKTPFFGAHRIPRELLGYRSQAQGQNGKTECVGGLSLKAK